LQYVPKSSAPTFRKSALTLLKKDQTFGELGHGKNKGRSHHDMTSN
jgi:hypothetical protein